MTDITQSQLDKLYLDSCESGKLDAVKAALAGGANLYAAKASGDTALHLAVITDGAAHVELATYLLSKGVDINATNNSGDTALFWASFTNTRAAHALLANGADATLGRPSGAQPIHAAAAQGNLALVLELLEKGASPDAVQRDGTTVLYAAAQSRHVHVVAALLDAVSDAGLADVRKACQQHGWVTVSAVFEAHDAHREVEALCAQMLSKEYAP